MGNIKKINCVLLYFSNLNIECVILFPSN